MGRRRSTWKTAAGAAGLVCLLPSSAAAWGEDLTFSVGLGVSFSFGGEVPRGGITFDARLAQILDPEVIDSCTRVRRTGVGVFVQGTWMGGPSRVAAGLHGGGELGNQAPFGTLEGELGWTWRSAWGGESDGHGLHFGLLAAKNFVDTSARLVLTPDAREANIEGIFSLGLRLPTPFGESLSTCVAGRPQRIDDNVILPNAWAVTRAEGSRAAGLAWLDAARAELASVPAFEVIRWALAERPGLRDVLSAESKRESMPHLEAVEDGERYGHACRARVEDAHEGALADGRSRARRLMR